jgi:hypothetical protein
LETNELDLNSPSRIKSEAYPKSEMHENASLFWEGSANHSLIFGGYDSPRLGCVKGTNLGNILGVAQPLIGDHLLSPWTSLVSLINKNPKDPS